MLYIYYVIRLEVKPLKNKTMNVIITKHFKDRMKLRFPKLSPSEVLVGNKKLSIFTKRNMNSCPSLVVRTKLAKGWSTAFVGEDRTNDLLICGNIDKSGRVFLNTVLPRG